MGSTTIEWTSSDDGRPGKVWNPVTGCTKVSTGCANCYAEGVAERFWAKQYPPVIVPAGIDKPQQTHTTRPRRFTDVLTHPDRLEQPLKWRKHNRVFVNSMSDLFHKDVSEDFLWRVFGIMARAWKQTFLILTKRPERMALIVDRFGKLLASDECHPAGDGRRSRSGIFSEAFPVWPLPNVHLGVSVENQETANARIPSLLQTPAAIRFCSYEPALGAVDFGAIDGGPIAWERLCSGVSGLLPPLDWLIAGGESGPKARPSELAWFRSAAKQCREADVPFFMKQLTYRGKKIPVKEWPPDLLVRQFPKEKT